HVTVAVSTTRSGASTGSGLPFHAVELTEHAYPPSRGSAHTAAEPREGRPSLDAELASFTRCVNSATASSASHTAASKAPPTTKPSRGHAIDKIYKPRLDKRSSWDVFTGLRARQVRAWTVRPGRTGS